VPETTREVPDAAATWSGEDVAPADVEEALRHLLQEQYARDGAHAPARVLNFVVVIDREWRGEIMNRLEQVGRYHASRTILCTIEPRRETIDASVVMTVAGESKPGELMMTRERVILELGEKHVAKLDTIVDPLLVPDLATMVWAPHGHDDGVDALRRLAQIILIDSLDAPEAREALERAADLADAAYVVDLAWLRSTPWRERVAAIFDPPDMRPHLAAVSGVTVRHREDSLASALLFCGWLASRIGWQPGSLSQHSNRWSGTAHTRRQEVKVRLEPHDQDAPGLAGVTIEMASGQTMALDRAPGGLRARRRERDGTEREWMVMGASRGEGGILGEGVRQALLRDPTYRPALAAAQGMVR
jgi:glucose-6-phosphate dehydrogenase assembly protein OpcA